MSSSPSNITLTTQCRQLKVFDSTLGSPALRGAVAVRRLRGRKRLVNTKCRPRAGRFSTLPSAIADTFFCENGNPFVAARHFPYQGNPLIAGEAFWCRQICFVLKLTTSNTTGIIFTILLFSSLKVNFFMHFVDFFGRYLAKQAPCAAAAQEAVFIMKLQRLPGSYMLALSTDTTSSRVSCL